MTTHDTAQDRLDEIRRRHTPPPGQEYCPECSRPPEGMAGLLSGDKGMVRSPCPTLAACGQPAARKVWALTYEDGSIKALFAVELAAVQARGTNTGLDVSLYTVHRGLPARVPTYTEQATVTGKGEIRRHRRSSDSDWNYDCDHLEAGPVVHSGKADRGGTWLTVTGLDQAAVHDLFGSNAASLVRQKRKDYGPGGPAFDHPDGDPVI